MHRRVFLLIFLLASVLVIRITQIYLIAKEDLPGPKEIGLVADADENHMIVKSIIQKGPAGDATPASRSGLKPKDKILAIYDAHGNRKDIRNLFDYGEAFLMLHYNEPWSLDILRDQGAKSEQLHISMPPTAKSNRVSAWIVAILLGIILPLITIFTSFFIGFMRYEDNTAFLASLFFLSFSAIFGVPSYFYPPGLRLFTIVFNSILSTFVVYLFMHFFLIFPTRSVIDRKFPWIKKVCLWWTILLVPLDLYISYALVTSFDQFAWLMAVVKRFQIVFTATAIAMFGIGLLSLALNTWKATTKDEKRRMRILLTGATLGLLPLVAFLMYSGVHKEWIPSTWQIIALALTLAIFPTSFIYVVLKERVLGIRLIVRRGLQYALISRGFFVIEGIVLFGLLYILTGAIKSLKFNASSMTLFGGIAAAFAGAVALRKMNRKAMVGIDRRFFREAYNTHQILTDLSRAVRQLAAQPDQLFDLVTDKISDSLYPDKVAIFLRGTNGSAGYRCCGLRVRSGHDDEVWCTPDKYLGWSLKEDSFLSRQLDEVANGEAQTLNVFLNDPKSWAHALAKLDPSDSRYHEKLLIEHLNTKLIVPLSSGRRSLGFISLGEKLSEEAYSKEDKQLLLTVAEQTAIALEYAQMIKQVADQEKMKREIQIAKEVQARLFPQSLPPMRSLQYTGVCKAARGVGGDYYDFLPLSQNRLGIALGDVAGKGISSALLMASLQALLRSGAPLRGEALDALMTDINRLMCESTEGNKYATFFYGLYDDEKRNLSYVNAGHLPPMLFSSNGKDPASVTRLRTGGTVVGMLPEATYQQDSVRMKPGDVLLLYSDGISEAMNERDEEFGEDPLIPLVASNLHLRVEEICDLIVSEVSKFVGDAAQSDDMTLVVAKII